MARPQINIRVEQETKDRWKREANESAEYDGLSHLIRMAVEKELSDSNSQQTTSDAALDGDSQDLLREVVGNTERVDDGIQDVKARLRTLEERVGQTDAKFSLRAAVRETLPEAPDDVDPTEPVRYEQWASTTPEVAARLNADVSEVRDELESLAEETAEVQSVGGGPDGETYYFRNRGV